MLVRNRIAAGLFVLLCLGAGAVLLSMPAATTPKQAAKPAAARVEPGMPELAGGEVENDKCFAPASYEQVDGQWRYLGAVVEGVHTPSFRPLHGFGTPQQRTGLRSLACGDFTDFAVDASHLYYEGKIVQEASPAQVELFGTVQKRLFWGSGGTIFAGRTPLGPYDKASLKRLTLAGREAKGFMTKPEQAGSAIALPSSRQVIELDPNEPEAPRKKQVVVPSARGEQLLGFSDTEHYFCTTRSLDRKECTQNGEFILCGDALRQLPDCRRVTGIDITSLRYLGVAAGICPAIRAGDRVYQDKDGVFSVRGGLPALDEQDSQLGKVIEKHFREKGGAVSRIWTDRQYETLDDELENALCGPRLGSPHISF